MDLNARLAKRMEATEKIATEYERNHVRDAALAAGGVGAIGVGSHIKPVELNTAKHTVKTLLGIAGALEIGPGVVGAASDELARRNATSVLHDPQSKQFATRALKASRNARLMQAGFGAAMLAAGRKINPVQLNKKKLVAHLGLITGGAAAAAAGAHGLMSEKKASKEEIKDKKVYQDYVNRRQEGIRNTWKGIGGLLGGLTVGSALAATGTPIGAGLGTLAAIGGYGYGLGKMQQGDYQIGQASYIDPARRDNLFWDFSITPTEARYTRDVDFLDRITGAKVDVTTKKASKEDKKKKAPSGFNRATRALLGHLVLPAAGIGTALAGAHIRKKYPTYRGHAIRPGIGKALALGGLATAAAGPWVNDIYQAGKYVEEH